MEYLVGPYMMEDEKYEGAAQMFKSAEKLVGTSKYRPSHHRHAF